MGTRFLVLLATFVGLSLAASAQTSNNSTDSFAIPATYALVGFDSAVVTVASAPIVTKVEPGAATSTGTTIQDGGDGISDAPDAGWQSEVPNKKID